MLMSKTKQPSKTVSIRLKNMEVSLQDIANKVTSVCLWRAGLGAGLGPGTAVNGRLLIPLDFKV